MPVHTPHPRRIKRVDANSRLSHSWLDTLERISTVISIAAVPLVLAGIGWVIQSRLQSQTVKRDYVQLATSILSAPDSLHQNVELKSWAADLLSENSPTPIPKALLDALKAGRAALPTASYVASGVLPIDSLRPEARPVAEELMKRIRAAGIRATITKTLVGREEQERLIAAGLTDKPYGHNSHNLGIAFDVTPEGVSLPSTADSATYIAICKLAKGMAVDAGIVSNKPYVHFELKLPAPSQQRCNVQP